MVGESSVGETPVTGAVPRKSKKVRLPIHPGEILFEGWNGEGVVLWDPASSKWTQYTSATIPGLSYDSWTGNVMYDELTGTIFANCNGGGLRAFHPQRTGLQEMVSN